MTVVNRNIVLLGCAALALLFISVAFAPAGSAFEGAVHYPVILLIEFVVYFIAAMVTNPRATIGMAAGNSVLLTLIRLVCGLSGGIFYGIVVGQADGYQFWQPWGNPVAAVIQVALLVIASPYVTAAVLPDLLGREALAALGARPAEPRRDGPAGGKESTPAGGFIQVYSYEELAGTLRKSPGLEGFIIASGEGLVVWRDLPLRVDAESLVARATELVREAGAMVGGGGMNRLRRLMIETKDHLVVVAPLNQHFELLLVFSGRVPAEEALGRVPLALRSTREFLMWKYADLAMAPAISGDRVMVDFA